jgi:hypothetical protein
MIDFKGSHFERDVTLWGVRWYVAYPMSYRQLEAMMKSEASQSTTPRSTAGSSSMRLCWRAAWQAGEDHDRQERRQHGSDRKLQCGA